MDRSRTHMQKDGIGALVTRYAKEAGIAKNVNRHMSTAGHARRFFCATARTLWLSRNSSDIPA